jgi:pinin/SDK/memA/ protein conserved region
MAELCRSGVIVQSTVVRPHLSPSPSPNIHADSDPPNEPDLLPSLSPSSPTTKRAISPSGNDVDAESPSQAKRRRLSADKERGRRMFGALMGTLTSFQKQSSKTARQRAEIDARVKEKVAKEKAQLAKNKLLAARERVQKEDDFRLKLQREYVSFPRLVVTHCRDGWRARLGWLERGIFVRRIPLRYIFDRTS